MSTQITSPTADPPPALEPHVAAFDAFEKSTTGDAAGWLRVLRTSGISYFAELGFPTTANEEWRFTNLAAVASFPFAPAPSGAEQGIEAEALESFLPAGFESHRLVFIDGHLSPALSRLWSRGNGATLGGLRGLTRSHAGLVESHLGRIARHETHPLVALNTAFLLDGAFIYVPPRVTLEAPVHLLFVSTQAGTVNQPRNLLIAGAGSRLKVIEDYVSLGEGATFTNTVTELFVGEEAQVEHLKIQRHNTASFHIGTLEARQERGSQLRSHSISFGAALARHDLNLRLQGEHCETLLNGLYVADGDQLVDHHTLADHAQPHGASHEFYHGILRGRAKGVFNGKIIVGPHAQKTDAKQSNRNLLLSGEATVQAKPQLEIFADDVKCTHGATVGQLDEEALFYLRSRGIGEDLARQMLIRAFATDVLNRISLVPVREHLDSLLATHLESRFAAI